MARKMRLAPEHLALVPPFSGETGRLAGRSDIPTEAEWEAVADSLLANAPVDGQIWIFAYGSLIWNPEFDFVEERLGTARGWRRSFCAPPSGSVGSAFIGERRNGPGACWGSKAGVPAGA